MKRALKRLSATAALVVAMLCVVPAKAQTIVKLNGLYALAGVINPQVEFRLSEHSAFQTEIVASPWKSVFGGYHMLFGILMNEYRYYVLPQKTRGFYVGANGAIHVFNMSKPTIAQGRIQLQNRYCKGYGFMAGICFGYEYRFAERWVVDAFIGMSYMASWYNGYSLDGVIDMHPHGHPIEENDPFNGSAEWLPNKIGVSIGYMIFNPKKK